jgi:hypothetical protein
VCLKQEKEKQCKKGKKKRENRRAGGFFLEMGENGKEGGGTACLHPQWLCMCVCLSTCRKGRENRASNNIFCPPDENVTEKQTNLHTASPQRKKKDGWVRVGGWL